MNTRMPYPNATPTGLPPQQQPVRQGGPPPTQGTPSASRSSSSRGQRSSQQRSSSSAAQQNMPPNTSMPMGNGPPARKKRRIGDKIISPQVRELVPESHAYMDLLAFEQKLDATISRKKLDIQEALKRPMKVKRKLRIYVSHTFFPAKEPEKEGDEPQAPTWELRVEGRLVDESGNPAAASTTSATTPAGRIDSKTQKRKFSSFFKSLVIELDKDIYGPDSHLVEWHRTLQTNETDGFQVKRPGDRNVKCTILLLLDHQPMKHKLHPRLAKILGLHTETRPKVIEALWQYIKTHKLQDPHERDHINCDQYLEQVFHCKRMRFMEIPQRLSMLLQQPDPIGINHVITVDTKDPNKTALFDIDVEIEDPLKDQMSQFVMSQASQQDIAGLDNKIYEIVEQINELKMRRDFYLGFADKPQQFIQKWLVSQSKDLKTMTEQEGDPEQERTSEYYYQPWTDEAVCRYYYNKIQQKRLELEQSLGVRQN